jgi:hypothetical protein
MARQGILFLMLLLLSSSFTLKSQPVAPSGQHWSVVSELTDEFNGTSLDRQKWLNYQPYWAGREPSQFDTNNVSLSGGDLILLSRVTNHEKKRKLDCLSLCNLKNKSHETGLLF